MPCRLHFARWPRPCAGRALGAGARASSRCWFRVLLLAGVVAAGGGCERSPERGRSGTPGGPATLAVVPLCTEEPFWKLVKQGAETGAQQLGATLVWEGTHTAEERHAQNRILASLAGSGVDGLAVGILAAADQNTPLRDVLDAGTPVVLLDPPGDWDRATCSIFSGRTYAGIRAAQKMLEFLGGHVARIVTLRHARTARKAEQRADGFSRTMTEASMMVLEEPYLFGESNGDPETRMLQMLQRHVRDGRLRLDGIFACSRETTLAAAAGLAALRAQDVRTRVALFGWGDDPELIELVRDDRVQMLLAENPKRLGYVAVETLSRALQGQSVPKTVAVEPLMFVP